MPLERPPSMRRARPATSVVGRLGALCSLFLALALFGGALSTASATTYYVRQTGNDKNSGLSPAQAWRTMQHAANTLVAGNVVYVGAGTYNETVKPKNGGVAASPLLYVADTTGAFTGDAGSVVLTKSGKDVLTVDGTAYLEFDGFRIAGGKNGARIKKAKGIVFRNCEIDSQSDRGIEADNAALSLNGCDIHSNGKVGIEAKKKATVTLFDSIVRSNGKEGIKIKDKKTTLNASRCEVHSNSKRGIQVGDGTAQVVNCLVHHNGQDGIDLKKGTASLVVWHTTIADNGGDGVLQEDGSATLTNSILASNSGSGIHRKKGKLTHTFNVVFGNSGGNYKGTAASTGEVSQDPQFVGGTDYHLLFGSPAIDAGTDASSATNVDRDGNPRPTGAGWDMGSYEFTSQTVNHFILSHDGSGIHCLGEPVGVTAADSAGSAVTNYVGAITLDTQSGKGSWSLAAGNGLFVDATPNDGVATYTYDAGDKGIASFLLNYPEGPPAIDIDVFETANPTLRDDDTEGNLTFSPSGFTMTAKSLPNPPPNPINDPIGTQTAGAPFSLHLAAYGQTPTDPLCGVIESYTGSKTLKFWSTYLDPASGTIAATIDGSTIATAEGSAFPQSVAFTNGQATVTAQYKDVGRIQLSVKDDTVSEPLTGIRGGTNPFVVRPADLAITLVERPDGTPNPGTSSPIGAVFVAAGAPFRVTVAALDAAGDLTPNYGNETTAEGIRLTASTLVAPAGGRNGSNNDGAIGNASAFLPIAPPGTFRGSTFSWDDVGAIRIRASVADGDYLGTGDVTGTESGVVGRFIPDHFDVSMNTPQFQTACDAGGFTYLGQPFDYSAGQEPVVTTTARSVQGTTTQNYAGSWFKLSSGSLTGLAYASASGTLSTPAPNPPTVTDLGAGIGTIAFDTGPSLSFQRTTPAASFAAEISLSANIIDGDGVVYASNPARFGAPTPGNGIAFSTSKTMRYGRIVVENAFGPEVLPLAVPLRAETFDGVAFAPHPADTCSSVVTANLGLTKTPPSLATTPSIANDPFLAGSAGLSFTPPGAGNDGTVDIQVDLSPATGANLPWLQYDWPTDGNADGVPDDNPAGRATFGVFRGSDRVIFRREVY